jgi:hypothetical protein
LLVTAMAFTVLASAAGAQVPDVTLPDLSSAEGRERAAASLHARLSAAIARAKSGEVIFARGPQGMPFVPIERRALRAYVAIQVQAGKLPASQAPALEQRLIAEHPAVLAEVEATLATLAPAVAANQGGAPMTGAELCELLKTEPGDVTVVMGGDCALVIGDPTRPDQFFTIGRPRDGRDACTLLRQTLAQAKSGVREVPGLGEFGFAGVSLDSRYGVAFCRNGMAFIGASDAAAPPSVQQAMLARARTVDARLMNGAIQTPGGRPSSPCEPPSLGAQAGVVAAALTLRSGECVPGQLIDMGGADYTMSVSGRERRIALADAALIDFTAGGDSGGSPPAGQHELVLRGGQRVTGRLYDLSGSGPLTVTFDSASGRQTWSSTEVDRIVLLPVATAGPGPGSGVTGTCASLPGDWRRDDGAIIRLLPGGAGYQGFIVNPGPYPQFVVGEQTFQVDGSLQQGVCTGQVLFKDPTGRPTWVPARITMNGTDAFNTDNAGRWIRTTAGSQWGAPPGGATPGGGSGAPLQAGGAPMPGAGGVPTPGTGAGPAGGFSASCASLPGDWRRDDGMVIRVAGSGAGLQAFILNPGPLTQFAAGEQVLQVNSSLQQGACTGQALFKDAAARPTWQPQRITMIGTDTFDTDNGGRWTRTAAGGQMGAPPAGPPSTGGAPMPGGAPTAPPTTAQAYANFTGEWNTINNGLQTVMRLQQQGNRVTGTYDYQDGLILGFVNGTTLTLTWTHAPANTFMGYGQFVMSADGRTFNGTWSSPAWGQQGTWTGTRR